MQIGIGTLLAARTSHTQERLVFFSPSFVGAAEISDSPDCTGTKPIARDSSKRQHRLSLM